ncbi:MAG: DUF2852 domain-containing protein [Pseudomonadota bacterium]
MPKMHMISLLATGGAICTLVGFTIARYAPLRSAARGRQDNAGPAGGSGTPAGWLLGLIRRTGRLRGRGLRETTATRPESTNTAFEAYRAATLERLHDEERAFAEYLDRLRKARDAEAFEAFLDDRPTAAQPPGPERAG